MRLRSSPAKTHNGKDIVSEKANDCSNGFHIAKAIDVVRLTRAWFGLGQGQAEIPQSLIAMCSPTFGVSISFKTLVGWLTGYSSTESQQLEFKGPWERVMPAN